MHSSVLKAALFILAVAPTSYAAAEQAKVPAPLVDHHFHLTGADITTVINGRPLPTINLPPPLATLLDARAEAWNDSRRLERLFAADAIVLVQNQQKAALFRGSKVVADHLAARFAAPYQMVAVATAVGHNTAHVTGYYVRQQPTGLRYLGAYQLGLTKKAAGEWQIASEIPAFPAAPPQQPVVARDAIAMLDAAGIHSAVVLSNAGAFGGRYFDPAGQYEEPARRHERVKAENDWSVAQVAQYPDRLISFCSLNPLEDYALEELRRCAQTGHRGLKMQFLESRVDLQNAAHVARLREVFSLADSLRLPLLVHVANNSGPDAVVAANMATFLDKVAAAAPNVTIQIAHLWGGGNYSEAALNALAHSMSAKHPATRNMYFDVAEAALVSSQAGEMKQRVLQNIAERIRQIGTDRILFGSDQFGGNHRTPKEAWEMFRSEVPLTRSEFARIASNVAPYLNASR